MITQTVMCCPKCGKKNVITKYDVLHTWMRCSFCFKDSDTKDWTRGLEKN